MNIFLTDKIYFHFDGENDGGEGDYDEDIGESDGLCIHDGGDKGGDKGGLALAWVWGVDGEVRVPRCRLLDSAVLGSLSGASNKS